MGMRVRSGAAACSIAGGRFEFAQERFDFLCNDLDDVTLARAVAASSAVPMVLSPVTVWNHAPSEPERKGCGEPLARAFAQSNADRCVLQSRVRGNSFSDGEISSFELQPQRDLGEGEPCRWDKSQVEPASEFFAKTSKAVAADAITALALGTIERRVASLDQVRRDVVRSWGPSSHTKADSNLPKLVALMNDPQCEHGGPRSFSHLHGTCCIGMGK